MEKSRWCIWVPTIKFYQLFCVFEDFLKILGGKANNINQFTSGTSKYYKFGKE